MAGDLGGGWVPSSLGTAGAISGGFGDGIGGEAYRNLKIMLNCENVGKVQVLNLIWHYFVIATGGADAAPFGVALLAVKHFSVGCTYPGHR